LSNALDLIRDPGETINTDCGRTGESDCLVVYNLGIGVNNADAYRGGNISAIKSIIPETGTSLAQLTFADHHFRFNSPQQRFMIIDKAQVFTCNLISGKLWLNEAYDFIDTDDEPPVFAGAHLVAEHISNCHFSYDAGTLIRPALVTLEIEISDKGEKVRLLQQIFVENQP
jgi:hypothetical protein